MNLMMAFGWAGIMLCLGVFLRARIPILRNMLVPASVIAGVIGMVLMNTGLINSTTSAVFTQMVGQLFTVSFISIGLTSTPKPKGPADDSLAKHVAKGSLGMGLVWNILYALTPAVGALTIMATGKAFGMDPFYGMLIPFAFAQGPGQAAAFGGIIEGYGWPNAAMVGITFAAVGFLVAFGIGVPLVKWGLKRGLAKNSGKIDAMVQRGYYKEEEQVVSLGKATTYSGNIDTMAFHFAVIGVCYVLAVYIGKAFALIPGFFGTTMSGLLFLNGMFAAYFVKFILRKLHIDYLLNNTYQSKITGWSADFLVVCAFMAVEFYVVSKWIVPIIIECVVITLVTLVVCLYFGRRFGGSNDFERTLGLFGTATGTVPSGIALVRIVDPELRTSTAVELGMMNIPMLLSLVTVMPLMAIASKSLSMTVGFLLLLAPIPVYLIIMRIAGVWGKKKDSGMNTGEGDA